MSDRGEVVLAQYEAFFQGHEQALQTWNLGPITQVVPGFRIFRAMTWNRAATVLPIWLNVFEDNLRGRHVYEKVGYRRFGTSEHEGRPLLLLEVHHFAAADITHLTVYVVGPHANLVQAWGAVERWFPQAVPPATLLGVSLLGHAGQLVEVDATIVRDDGVRG